VNGLVPAMWVGAAVLAVGAVIALVLPFDTRAAAEAQAQREAGETAQRTAPAGTGLPAAA
jgi:hypothetical protein